MSDDDQIGIFHGDFRYVAKFFKQPHTYGKLHVERFAPEIMGCVDHILELQKMTQFGDSDEGEEVGK